MDQVRITEKHDLLSRWTHWVNFPLLTLMVWSGLLIYWANPAYVPLPDSVAEALRIDQNLATGMQWHFFLMWLFLLNGLLFLAAFCATGRWRDLRVNRRTLADAFRFALHDLHLSKTAPSTADEMYNPAQKLSYIAVFVLAAGAVISGFAIYKPVQLSLLTEILGGYEAARFEHFACMLLLVAFFVIHIIQVIRAGWNQFRSMVTGYEVDND